MTSPSPLTRDLTLTLPGSQIAIFSVHPDPASLCEQGAFSAGSYDGTLFVWELHSGAVVATLKDRTQVRCLTLRLSLVTW